MNYQAIIFDLDGTLLDTLDDITAAGNRTLVRFGYPTHDRQAYRQFVGSGGSTLMTRALPAGEAARLGEAGLRAIIEVMREDYYANAAVATRPYPGIAALLARIAEAGLVCGILSNKPDRATQAVVRHFFAQQPFAAVQGQLPDVPLKPDPTSALDMAARFGCAPGRVVYLGDSDIDMRTARAAGMHAAGAAWGFRGEEELRASGAQTICHTPDDIATLLFA